MENFKVDLTAQELDDIRVSLTAAWMDIDRLDGKEFADKSDRLSLLMDKLARVSVFGHA